jgi:hypothetical protein
MTDKGRAQRIAYLTRKASENSDNWTGVYFRTQLAELTSTRRYYQPTR